MFSLEEQNLFRLIESWDAINIELAFQIMEGNAILKTAAEQRYLPMLTCVYRRSTLNGLKEVGQRSVQYFVEQAAWQLTPVDIEVLATLPITKINFSYYNDIMTLPLWIFYVTKLQSFKCSGQLLTTIPPQVNQWKALIELDLTRNKITTIPDEVAAMEKLEILNLDHNPIVEVPTIIGKLSNLKWLCLEAAKIEALPITMLDLAQLEWLSIEKTPLGDRHGVNKGRILTIQSPLLKRLVGIY